MYTVIFDVRSHGFDAWRSALPPTLFAIGAIAVGLIVRCPMRRRLVSRSYCILLLAVILLAAGDALATLRSTRSEYDDLRDALRYGHYRLVDGVVSNFVPERADGHPNERFDVGRREYRYSTYDITSAFHWTAGQGGPMHDGAAVRIYDVNGAIARLEIARP